MADDLRADGPEEDGPAPDEEIAAACEARAAFYETLAALYFMPLKQEDVDRMAQADFSVWKGLDPDFDAGLNDITRYLRKRNTGTRDEMAVDFTGAFAGVKVWEGLTAVPYKSVFTDEEGLMCRAGYREVLKAFRAERVRKREGLDWPDDHLSFMCEFMALMSRRILADVQAGDLDRAAHDVEASLAFLDDNILSWFDAFRERALLLVTTRFYRGVLSMSRGFFTMDREALVDLGDEIARRAQAGEKGDDGSQ